MPLTCLLASTSGLRESEGCIFLSVFRNLTVQLSFFSFYQVIHGSKISHPTHHDRWKLNLNISHGLCFGEKTCSGAV